MLFYIPTKNENDV